MIVTNKAGISYYALERIGQNRIITPEGFLLCLDVPVSRTGRMLYGYGEVFDEDGKPLETADGVTYVDRSAEDIFSAETLASFDGKPIVNDHPEDDVDTHNWRQLASGVMLRPRRGTGIQDDLTVADLLITNQQEIDAVNNDKREVSLGYKAKYQKTGTATYRQHSIIGNHLALVDNGRCGRRCSIGDKKTVHDKERNMTWLEKLKAAIGAKDEAAIDAALAEAPKEQVIVVQRGRTRDAHKEDCDCADCKEGKTKDRTMDARMKKVEDSVDSIAKDVKTMKDAWEKEEKEEKEKKDKEEKETKDNTAIEGSLEMEAPPGTGDRAFFKTVKDSASAKLDEPWQETLSIAEIIAPDHGITLGTFDAKAAPRNTLDALCKFRKAVLGLAYLQPETHVFIDSVTGSRDFKTFDCDGTRTLFKAVGQYKRSFNNRKETTSDAPLQSSGSGVGTTATPANLNKKYSEYWDKQPA
jgi:hypothetical protein